MQLFKYKDIKFVDSGYLLNIEKKGKKQKLNILSQIHIIGYKEKDGTVSAICLEYGIFADGKNEIEARNKVLFLTKEFIIMNTKATVEKILQSSVMDQYWALYRLYEKRKSRTLSKITEKKKERNNTTGEKLKEENSRLREENSKLKNQLKNNEEYIEYLTKQLQNNQKKSDEWDEPIFIKSTHNTKWAL